MSNVVRVDDDSGLVSKLVFEYGDGAIAEAVAYRYQDRGVVCFSTESGCRVGCMFCGTGKKFIRSLTYEEQQEQIDSALAVINESEERENIQLMAMSMGEPMDNWDETNVVIRNRLAAGFDVYLSTVGLRNPYILNDILRIGHAWPRSFGLQFSLHDAYEASRRVLLGGRSDLLTIEELKLIADMWRQNTNSPCYFNYIFQGGEDEATFDAIYGVVKGHHLTCSVMCDTGGFTKGDRGPAEAAMAYFLCKDDMSVSMFDPAGQDTIGGGCGQLLFTQERLR